MIERLGIALALLALGLGAYTLGTRWQVSRVRRRGISSEILEALRPGIPAVIYFWSEGCAPCRLVQKPALEQLQAELGPQGVQIVPVNAVERPDLADEWGVLSLPTTFIVDGEGRPRRVNHGVARTGQLRRQIEELGRPAPNK
ncbi:MAG TPA: thioredoxin [Chloroflexi bacterium]|nr:thioredoxin [Chloroflexota bacterium]